ncbi:succinate-semialdehyde dehydrogenase (NADP(+)), partial [Vibrio natriegens]
MKLNDTSLLKQACLVAGNWVTALDEATMPVINPSTGKVIAHVPVLGKDETLSAIHAAEKAMVT